MHMRETARQIRQTPRYFQFDHQDETFTFRLPGALDMRRIREEVDLNDLISTLIQAQKDLADNTKAAAAVIDRIAHQIKCVNGVLLGLAWHHEMKDLDAQIDDFDSIVDYGHAVLMELDRDFDISLELAEKIAAHISVRINETAQLQAEVAERVAFFPVT